MSHLLTIMCHSSMSRVTAVHESCHTDQPVMSRSICESCHTDQPVMSRSICPRLCACMWAYQCVFMCICMTSGRGVCVCVFLGVFKCVCTTSEGELEHVHVFRCVFIYVSVTLGRRVCVRACFYVCIFVCVRELGNGICVCVLCLFVCGVCVTSGRSGVGGGARGHFKVMLGCLLLLLAGYTKNVKKNPYM